MSNDAKTEKIKINKYFESILIMASPAVIIALFIACLAFL